MLCLQQEDYCKDQYCGYDSQEYPVYGFLGFCCLPSGIRSPGFNRREIFQKLLGLFLMGGRDHDFVAGNRVAGIKLRNSSLNSCINTVFFQKRKHLLRLNTAFTVVIQISFSSIKLTPHLNIFVPVVCVSSLS